MNNIIKGISITLGCFWMTSCSEMGFGDRFLGNQPESSGATTAEMFSSKANADKVLTKAYTGLLYGLPVSGDYRMGGNILEAITDLCQSSRDNINDGPLKSYYNGSLSPTNIPASAAYVYGGKSDWTTIRYAWMYIENVDKVPDISVSDKNERIAEAKTLIALSYFRMMRYVGGVCWLDHSVDINEKMDFPRITFDQTIRNIVALLDEAIPHLQWKQRNPKEDDGRMIMAGAMALKFQVLQWAASPTFNSDKKWHPAADEYTCYGNYSKDRWIAAEKAGTAFFNEVAQRGGFSLIQPDADTHKARRLAYRKAYYDRGGTEVLISIRKGYGPGTHDDFIGEPFYTGPTLDYVDMFPWSDGADFPEDFDWKKPSKQPFFVYSEKDGMVPTRDPRLYENVACPGDIFRNGMTAPVYINHPSYNNGTGFLIMKFILQESSDRNDRPVQWSYLRLAELMLGYAEVLNETHTGPTVEAYQMVNEVRARVGLSALPEKLNQKQFLTAVMKERALELGFEEVRWFDLVRRDCQQDFTKPLHGLRTKGNDLNYPTAFTFEKFTLDQRYWAGTWDTKWYLTPIPQNEINKKYGMTQNPGW